MSNLLKTYGGIGARNVSSTGHVTTRVNECLYMKSRIQGRASRRRQDLLRRIVAFDPRRGLTCALDPSTRSTTGSKFPDPVMTSVSTRVKAPLAGSGGQPQRNSSGPGRVSTSGPVKDDNLTIRLNGERYAYISQQTL